MELCHPWNGRRGGGKGRVRHVGGGKSEERRGKWEERKWKYMQDGGMRVRWGMEREKRGYR